MTKQQKYGIAFIATLLGVLLIPFLADAQVFYQNPTYYYTNGYYPVNLTNNIYSYNLPTPLATNNIVYTGIGGTYYTNSIPSITSYTSVNPTIYNWAVGPNRWTTSYPINYASNQNNLYGVTGRNTCPSNFICGNNQVFFYSY